MAAFRFERFLMFAAAILLLGFLLPACSSGPAQNNRLPNFPEYKPAEDFLILQKRLERYRRRPRPLLLPRFNDRSRYIYRKLERQQALARGELKLRAQQQRDFENLKNLQAGRNYEDYQNRVAQAEIDQAQREVDFNRIKIRNSQNRFAAYQQRVEGRRLEQEAIDFLRDQEVQKLLQRNAAFVPQSSGGFSISPFSGGPAAQ